MRAKSITVLAALIATTLLSIAAFAQGERRLYVSVQNSRGELVQNLMGEHFKIAEDGRPVAIRKLDANQPVSVGIVFDVSGSVLMAGERDVNEAAQSIYRQIKANSANGEFFLIGFNREAKLLTDWTSDPEKIAEGLHKLPSLQSRSKNNVTSFHATGIEAIAKVSTGKFDKKALIFFSDGMDSSDNPRQKELIRQVQQNDVLVYFVNISTPPPFVTVVSQGSGEPLIHDLTTSSGGKLFSVPSTMPENQARGITRHANSKMEYAFEDIFLDLRAQYALTFVPSAEPAKDTRSIEVELNLPAEIKKSAGKVAVRYRKKYRVAK